MSNHSVQRKKTYLSSFSHITEQHITHPFFVFVCRL